MTLILMGIGSDVVIGVSDSIVVREAGPIAWVGSTPIKLQQLDSLLVAFTGSITEATLALEGWEPDSSEAAMIALTTRIKSLAERRAALGSKWCTTFLVGSLDTIWYIDCMQAPVCSTYYAVGQNEEIAEWFLAEQWQDGLSLPHLRELLCKTMDKVLPRTPNTAYPLRGLILRRGHITAEPFIREKQG